LPFFRLYLHSLPPSLPPSLLTLVKQGISLLPFVEAINRRHGYAQGGQEHRGGLHLLLLRRKRLSLAVGGRERGREGGREGGRVGKQMVTGSRRERGIEEGREGGREGGREDGARTA